MTELISKADTNIIHAIQSIGPAWYVPAHLVSAIIGSMLWFIPVIIVALFLIGKHRIALEIIVISAVSILFIYGLKYMIAAPRPYWIDPSIVTYDLASDYGMPSAHAFISVIVFGWLWFRHPKSTILGIGSVALIFLIGISRVYLGLHYPSQIIVGWFLGLVFLGIFYSIHKRLWSPFKKKLS